MTDRWHTLRAAAAAATPGEWLHTVGHGDDWIGIADGERPNFRGGIICEPPIGWAGSMEWWPANAAHIAAASPATVLALLAERDALLAALREIADSHIPDQPAVSECDELTWAKYHVAKLRRIASRAAIAAAEAAP